MDSIKQYNLAGVASEVELGKRGPKIDATSADKVSLKKRDGGLTNAEIADGTEITHAVTKSQLDAAIQSKLSDVDVLVNYDDETVDIGTFSADTTVVNVSISNGPGNWMGVTSSTNISVGTTENNTLLSDGFDPSVQVIEERNFEFQADTAIKAFITTGGAQSGTAIIRIQYAGTFTPAA